MLGAVREVPRYFVRSSTSYAAALPVLNMRHSAQAVLAQRKQNGSAHVPKNWMSITTNLELLYLILSLIF